MTSDDDWEFCNPDRGQEVKVKHLKDFWTQRYYCPSLCLEPGNFAHGVFEALAATLAAPLRKAWKEHIAECWPRKGPCETCDYLGGLLPVGDRPVAIG